MRRLIDFAFRYSVMVRWTVLAIIKSRQSRPEGGFGWWRLMPPGYGGRRLRAGTPHPSRLRRATFPSRGRLEGCIIQRREALKGKANVCGDTSSGAARHLPLKGKANGGVPFSNTDPARGRPEGCGGRRGKRLPWLGQAAAPASAPVSVHAVLLTDNGDERLCPRGNAGKHN